MVSNHLHMYIILDLTSSNSFVGYLYLNCNLHREISSTGSSVSESEKKNTGKLWGHATYTLSKKYLHQKNWCLKINGLCVWERKWVRQHVLVCPDKFAAWEWILDKYSFTLINVYTLFHTPTHIISHYIMSISDCF